MATARGMFDAAKHPRGFHGRFGSGAGVRMTHEVGGGRRASHRSSPDEGLFGIKAGRFGRTRSAHGKKQRTTFNKLVFDARKGEAVTVRRYVTRY